ncbi:hypothetical protein AB6A40_007343 [Gnathostoma spinigerum]|uniref:TTI1 N-terminal TPR domain-containing protein n=1 Tax=Gnathostoma spinigerum TaxID=75299 RepID=A0ABD6ER37_9BILA
MDYESYDGTASVFELLCAELIFKAKGNQSMTDPLTRLTDFLRGIKESKVSDQKALHIFRSILFSCDVALSSILTATDLSGPDVTCICKMLLEFFETIHPPKRCVSWPSVEGVLSKMIMLISRSNIDSPSLSTFLFGISSLLDHILADDSLCDAFYSPQYRHAVGYFISNALDVLNSSSRDPELRMRAGKILLQTVSTKSSSSVDTLSFVLPGVCSRLCKVIVKDKHLDILLIALKV